MRTWGTELTKRWEDSPTIPSHSSAEDVLLALLAGGYRSPSSIRDALTAAGVARDDASKTIDGMISAGRIKITWQYSVSLP